MKKMIIAACLVAGLQATHVQEVEAEEVVLAGSKQDTYWSVSADFLQPEADDFWDTASGVTLKYTKWERPGSGFALSVGIQRWNANEELVGFVEPIGSVDLVFGGRLKGDAMVIPLMAVGVYQFEMSPSVNLHLEAGIGYAFVNSDITLEDGAAAFDARGNLVAFESYENKVDIEGNFMGNVAAELRYKSTPASKYTWFAGAGLMFDGIQGDTTTEETPLSYGLKFDTELQALFARFGVSADF